MTESKIRALIENALAQQKAEHDKQLAEVRNELDGVKSELTDVYSHVKSPHENQTPESNKQFFSTQSQHLVFDQSGRNDFESLAERFKPTNKESYSVYACVAPVGTKFENPLENASYETKNADTVILSGTQGELWTTDKNRVANTYRLNGEAIDFDKISKDCGADGVCADWVEIQTKPQPQGSVFAMQLAENQTATVETSWATLEAKPGGFIVCDAKDGKPDMTSLRVIDEEVFMKTHNLEAFPEFQDAAKTMDLSTPVPTGNFMPESYKEATAEKVEVYDDPFGLGGGDFDVTAFDRELNPDKPKPSNEGGILRDETGYAERLKTYIAYAANSGKAELTGVSGESFSEYSAASKVEMPKAALDLLSPVSSRFVTPKLQTRSIIPKEPDDGQLGG
jgi:hypothetical protein